VLAGVQGADKVNVNVFYFRDLNVIGGIETFFYQLGTKYGKDFDITVYYRTGSPSQVERLSKVLKVRRYRDGQIIRCKRAFLCFNLDLINYIEADEYYQMLHGDYTAIRVYPDRNPKISRRIAVSNVVRESYKDYIGDDSIVCYNPYTPVKPRKVLRLISATRLTAEKGYNRMAALAELLDKANIPFTWDIYTDSNKPLENPSVAFREPRNDILDFIADADYLVQLSDTEGYCYTVVEALCAGTPVIVTDFKVAREIGVEHGVNGWILPMDMCVVPVSDIYKGLKRFTYTPPVDKWDTLLAPGKSDDVVDMEALVTIRCKKVYYDLELQQEMGYGETWSVPMRRANKLLDLDLVEWIADGPVAV
jgi:glycosyltransferase involved in cell wall biosynthesis